MRQYESGTTSYTQVKRRTGLNAEGLDRIQQSCPGTKD